jgi:acetolactate synthase-1/2/3 large subunit
LKLATNTFSDEIITAFEDSGVKEAFIVTGGAVGPITTALAESEKITCHYMLTEQSAAIAAESYGYIDGSPALLVVTSGPGVTNALTGVAAAYTNSSPVIVISGQARAQDIEQDRVSSNRQIGNQHLNTAALVTPIVKGFIEPLQPIQVRPLVESMIALATGNRPGPVWLSIPQDVQRSILPLTAPLDTFPSETPVPIVTIDEVESIKQKLSNAERPVILLGNGARPGVAGLMKLARDFSIPIITTWPGLDLVHERDPLFVGRPGSIPSGWMPNLLLEECDLLLIVGARMDLAQVGYNPSEFAKQAHVVRIEIDPAENFRLSSHENQETLVRNSIGFNSYVGVENGPNFDTPWWARIRVLRNLPRAGEISQEFSDGLSTYMVVNELGTHLSGHLIVTGSSGTCVEMVLQSWKASEGQRVINSCGLGSMGFGVAAALGVLAREPEKLIACIESDGSLVMNLQDLVSASKIRPSFPIFVLDSLGYKSISLSQKRQGSIEHGSGPSSGLSLIDVQDGGDLLGIPVKVVSKENEISAAIKWALEAGGPRMVFFRVSKSEEALPRLMTIVDPLTGKLTTPKMSQLHPPI